MSGRHGVHVFQKPTMAIECDRCGVRFNLIHGGVCARCQRILCRQHLHGSWLRVLMVDVGARPVCVDCRESAGDQQKAADKGGGPQKNADERRSSRG